MLRSSVKIFNPLLKRGVRNIISFSSNNIRSIVVANSNYKIVGPRKSPFFQAIVTIKRSISDEPKQLYTKLSDTDDKNRDTIFQYTWGTWLTNDKLEKEKRVTKFSIEGLTKVINNIYQFSKTNPNTKNIIGPIKLDNQNINILPNNTTVSNLNILNPDEKQVFIKTVSSIHEGKHHRVYKLTTNIPNKDLILRIPYLVDSPENIFRRMQSEIATQDFINIKLKIDTPKIFAYGLDSSNPVGIPFVIQEYISGDLLMKRWDPLLDDEPNGKPKQQLMDVIDCISDIYCKLLSFEFRSIGSIYFKKDVMNTDYSDKISEIIDDRWCIGPIVERNFWKDKKQSPSKEQLGPWDKKDVTLIIKNLASVELENVKQRLALIEAGSSPEIDKIELLKEQKRTFENMINVSPYLFTSALNSEVSQKIPNFVDLLKPRLFLPDLDPMNIIINSKDGNKPYLIDFENTSVKPFIIQNSPKFVEYDGPKIYNIKSEIPEYEKLPDTEKAQCQFIYKRTRNQYLWEDALNKRQPKLITSMAPPIKRLRSPYVAMSECKTDDGYLIIDENLLQLKTIWSDLFENKIVSRKDFPLEFTKEQIEKHINDINKLHQKLISTPFAATKGWVPQEMFDTLLNNGVIVPDENGNYVIKSHQKPTAPASSSSSSSKNQN